ncbi:MAG: endopeptidase La [Tissierellia bacterium]|nr:endopeptidase La [Bacillota bacterium]NLL22928.1 endopeptidase La [Tissierellia bacterium]
MENRKLLPLIPLRGLIIFPYMVLYFDVGRDKSIEALEEAMLRDQQIFLTTQKEMEVEDPLEDDFYRVGTVAKIKQMLKLPGDNIRVLVEGQQRARYTELVRYEPYFEVNVEPYEPEVVDTNNVELEALSRGIRDAFERYIAISNRIPQEMAGSITGMEDIVRFADLIIPQLGITLEQKQQLLEEEDLIKRLRLLHSLLIREIEVVEMERDLGEKVKEQLNKMQKEYFLREQMRVIQQELGEDEDTRSEADKLMERLNKLRLKKSIHEKVEKEIKKLSRMNPSSPDASVTLNYVEWILDLPWNKQTKEEIDLAKARIILDEDHYAMERVKERVLEYLAVRKLTNSLKGPIICLVGPPGVGKTSIAASIARSVNRKFVRMSLGGVRDEAEIRGHRRTYVGAIPGRVMTLIKESKSKNPLFLFDEIDKLASDFRGDPASALLEVLDPEQNKSFVDHYLEVPFDLSKVMFLTTANTTTTIPRPLLDRMEVIELTGYTLFEKEEIAKRYLIPKQKKENGLEQVEIKISKEALRDIIEEHTRESGVRELERKLATIMRKIATIVVEKGKDSYSVTKKGVIRFLGQPRYQRTKREEEDRIGMVTGLAWTSVGGDTLEIEVSLMSGSGKLKLTGKLGDVMKESAEAGLSFIRSISEELSIEDETFKNTDIHVHVPAGAIPKDGPSAGITMATAMASALTQRKVHADLAMTGEVTLRGRVLPIGGLKEKLLAANRYGIKKVLVPEANRADIEEIPQEVLKGLTIKYVSEMNEVLAESLV